MVDDLYNISTMWVDRSFIPWFSILLVYVPHIHTIGSEPETCRNFSALCDMQESIQAKLHLAAGRNEGG